MLPLAGWKAGEARPTVCAGTLTFPNVKVFVFLRFSLFIFRERRRKGEGEVENHQCVVASHIPPIEDLARNPGMCPD